MPPSTPSSDQDLIRTESGRSTFLELLLAAALLGVVVLTTLPWLFATIHRARLTRTAKEVRESLLSARFQARKLGLPVVVAWISERRQIVAFVDVNANVIFDEEIDHAVGAPVTIRPPVELRGPGDGSGNGAHSIVGFQARSKAAARSLTFVADGSVRHEGAFRFADPRGNILEVRARVSPDSPISISKWRGGRDIPANWSDIDDRTRPWRWD